jgi:hypothetical protein
MVGEFLKHFRLESGLMTGHYHYVIYQSFGHVIVHIIAFAIGALWGCTVHARRESCDMFCCWSRMQGLCEFRTLPCYSQSTFSSGGRTPKCPTPHWTRNFDR